MALFTTNLAIGAGGNNTDFLDGQAVWAGGYAPATPPTVFDRTVSYAIGDLVVVTANDNTVWRATVAITATPAAPRDFTVAEWGCRYAPATPPTVFDRTVSYAIGDLVVVTANDNTVWRATVACLLYTSPSPRD